MACERSWLDRPSKIDEIADRTHRSPFKRSFRQIDTLKLAGVDAALL